MRLGKKLELIPFNQPILLFCLQRRRFITFMCLLLTYVVENIAQHSFNNRIEKTRGSKSGMAWVQSKAR